MPEKPSEEPFDWQCPFCRAHSAITSERTRVGEVHLDIDNPDGRKFVVSRFILCPSPSCRKYALYVSLHEQETHTTGGRLVHFLPGETIQEWQLVPSSSAKVFPSYIPKPLLDDYQEACAIVQLSPKSSATLARRVLQGMIRDFWKVRKDRLVDEIKAIKEKVELPVWKAIESLRKMGNIAAHMEEDINLVLDVEPKEARALIGLVEMLFQEWYVARHDREERLAHIEDLAEAKDEQKKEARRNTESGHQE